MYVLQLDETERDYLFSLLKSQRGSIARALAAQLRNSQDVFGLVWWSEADIASKLTERSVPATPDNISVLYESYSCRHIAERMIEQGWSLLEGWRTLYRNLFSAETQSWALHFN